MILSPPRPPASKSLLKEFFSRRTSNDSRSSSSKGKDYDLQFAREIIEKSDNTIAEAERFFREATEILDFSAKANHPEKHQLHVSLGRINKWRAKQKQNNLFGRYEVAKASLIETEATLLYLTEKSLANSSALLLQSTFIHPRLKECVNFNTKELEYQSPFVREIALVLENLKEMEAMTANMLLFFDEVDLLEQRELNYKHQAFVPWHQQKQKSENKKEEEEETEKKKIQRKTLQKKLGKIRKSILRIEGGLSMLTKNYARRKTNFEHGVKALQKMDGALKKTRMIRGDEDSFDFDDEEEAPGEEEEAPGEEEESDLPRIEIDIDTQRSEWIERHNKLCADCICTCAMADDCLENMTMNQMIAEEATKRYQILLHLKTSIFDSASVLESMDWGSSRIESKPQA